MITEREVRVGTPSTLIEAVAQAVLVGPVCDIPKRAPRVMRDWMSQKFQIALLKHRTPEAQAALKDAWELLTGEKL